MRHLALVTGIILGIVTAYLCDPAQAQTPIDCSIYDTDGDGWIGFGDLAWLGTCFNTGVSTLSITQSRTTGVAPLAVHFRAVSSAAGDPFRELSYVWSFGASGPLAAHVFDVGTHVVTVDTGSAQATVEIVATDPDALTTTCVANADTFEGCPSGAAHLETASFGASVVGGGRILFRRGDTFTSSAQVTITAAGPGLIGAFGTGAKPIINVTFPGTALMVAADDWRISDLEFVGSNGAYSAIQEGATTSNTLIYRNTVSGFISAINFSGSGPKYLGTPPHDGAALVENTITNGPDTIYFSGSNAALVGNTITGIPESTHAIRIGDASDGLVIAGNDVGGASIHALKLHAQAVGPGQRDTTDFAITGNTFRGRGAWTVGIGPQDAFKDERVRHGVIDGNTFVSASGVVAQLVLWTQDVTARNNRFELCGTNGGHGIILGQRGIEPLPSGNVIEGSTCVGGGECVRVDVAGSATVSGTTTEGCP